MFCHLLSFYLSLPLCVGKYRTEPVLTQMFDGRRDAHVVIDLIWLCYFHEFDSILSAFLYLPICVCKFTYAFIPLPSLHESFFFFLSFRPTPPCIIYSHSQFSVFALSLLALVFSTPLTILDMICYLYS